jgi:hypothetical protein
MLCENHKGLTIFPISCLTKKGGGDDGLVIENRFQVPTASFFELVHVFRFAFLLLFDLCADGFFSTGRVYFEH